MLLEDRLKPSDIMNMKENYERQGKWEYEMSSQKKRIKTLFETEEKQTQMSLRGEVQKGKAVPRTTMICVWKGSDEDGKCSSYLHSLRLIDCYTPFLCRKCVLV